ncbi:MAG: SDR family oxidoreductase [Alphaproteobacteria bacterium]|nr:SDR family oxidoreductase [Alphaproteobacteria bacterium]
MTINNQKGTALVTGAAHRIGRAMAEALATEGWNLALHYNSSKDSAEALATELREKGVSAITLKADLAKGEEVSALIPQAGQALGPVTLLVNNASIFESDTIRNGTKKSWDIHMGVNLHAPFLLTQAFANSLPENLQGNVINLIDQRVWNLTPHFASYTVSKAGLWTLTQTTALALAPQIRVNAIGPGPTLKSIHQTDEQFTKEYTTTPLQRSVDLDEICNAMRFILTTPSMTGQMVALDSGQHLGYAQPASGIDPDLS